MAALSRWSNGRTTLKRVLVVVHYPTFGGPHNRAMQLAEPLRRAGWDTLIALPREAVGAAERLVRAGVQVRELNLHRARATLNPLVHLRFLAGFMPQVLQLRNIIRREQIDVVLIGGLMNPHGAIAARMARVPVIWQIVDTVTPAFARGFLLALVKRCANVVMFNGKKLVGFHGAARLGLPTVVYYPPVDTTARFRPCEARRKQVRDEFAIPQTDMVVGTVANLNRKKGVEYFIRAAGEVYQTRGDVTFVVVGARYKYKQAYNQLLDEELRRSGIPPERFLLTGERSDVERFYSAMDVMVVSSIPKSEGTTTTAIEAMATGIPVVATDVGAVSEIVLDGKTGYLVPPQDSGALAKATLRLLGDERLRAHQGAAALKRARDHFDISACLREHLRALEEAMA